LVSLIALAVMLQAAGGAVPIFVGPTVRDGFVDIDKGVQDSIDDLRQELGKNPSLRLVEDERSAKLRLLVAERRRFNTGKSVVTGVGTNGSTTGGVATSTGVSIPVEGYRVETVLRADDYEKTLIGESETRWKGCAQSIADDVAVWLKANRERLLGDAR
jgi:hypothetical protein